MAIAEPPARRGGAQERKGRRANVYTGYFGAFVVVIVVCCCCHMSLVG